jgi:cholesterol 7-dehydrogenase
MFGCYTKYRPVADTGFQFPNKELSKNLVSKKDILNEVRRRRKAGDLPPVYPNGWFSLIRTEELAVSASTSVNALGENFAIFRDDDGKVHILDAYCAHLGANLAVGGKVCVMC